MSFIKTKIVLFCIIIVSLITINFLWVEHLNHKTSVLKSATALSYKIQSDVLMLRRHEKDFLSRQQRSYLVKFTKSYQVIKHDLIQLRQYLEQLQFLQKESLALEHLLENYIQLFKAITDLQLDLGLSPEEGLYGKLRHDAHRIENYLQPIPDSLLMNSLLSVRRFEKDFMLRSQIEYFREWEDKIKLFQNRIMQSTLEKQQQDMLMLLVGNYEQSLRSYAKNIVKRGLNYHNGMLAELSYKAGHIEQSLTYSTKRLVEYSTKTQDKAQYYTHVLMMIFGIGILSLCFLPILLVFGSKYLSGPKEPQVAL